jgi:hypothetical protein
LRQHRTREELEAHLPDALVLDIASAPDGVVDLSRR